MKLVGVFSSDAVTRSNTAFSAGALYGSLADRWECGVPTYISHDAHRLLGWTHPRGLSFQRGTTSLHGSTTIPDTAAESVLLQQRYRALRAQEVMRRTAASIPTLEVALQGFLDGTEKPHHCEGTALVSIDLARKVAPDLFKAEDKDGLVPTSSLQVLQPGVYQRGPIALFAHPFLRRSLSRFNTLNTPFLAAVEAAPDAKIRLDPDMVGLASTVHTQIELEYWWGPKFPATFTDLQPGICRHEATARQRFFYGISATEFWWQFRKGEWILEVEELRNLPTFGGNAGEFGCRYVHSILGEETGHIIHLDGAIRAYSEEKLLERLDANIAAAGRNTVYTKLWRVDGNLAASAWKDLIHHFFRDNPLVGEYLGAEPEPLVETPATVQADDPISLWVPHSILRNGGARFFVSIHPLTSVATDHNRLVVPTEEVTLDSSARPAVSAETIYLHKTLRARGKDLHIPGGCARVACEDRYTRLPLISHLSRAEVAVTLEAVNQLLEAWIKLGQEARTLSAAFEAPVESAVLRVAVVGTVAVIPSALAAIEKVFSCDTHADVASWATEAAIDMSSEGNEPIDLGPFLTPSSTFKFPRVSLDRDEVIPRENGSIELALPEADEQLIQAVRVRRLVPVPCWLLTMTRCTSCKRDFTLCEHLTFQNGMMEEVEDATLLRWFWTDLPA